MNQIREPSESEKAWFAGMLDGEGCIHISKEIRQSGYCRYRLIADVINTFFPALEKIKEIWKAGNINPTKGIKRPIWRWRSHGNTAEWILEHAFPYLVIKREQALLAIAFQKHKRESVRIWSAAHFPAYVHTIEDEFRDAVMSLNQGKVEDVPPNLLKQFDF